MPLLRAAPAVTMVVRCSNWRPGDPIVKAYLKDLQHLKDQLVVHQLGLKGLFR
jgi:hypothetical protein